MKTLLKLIIGSLLLFTTACATVVTQDYPIYLSNNQGEMNFKSGDIGKSYYLTPDTISHKASIKSFQAGIGNSWVVEFRDIMKATIDSTDFKKAFGDLNQVSNFESTKDRVFYVDLKTYSFADKKARISLNLRVMENGKEIFNKSYSAEGNSQGGKMFWGGAMAMKNAIQQSTKYAMDNIISDFSRDFKVK